MSLKFHSLCLLVLLVGFIHSEIHYVCEICTCDNVDQPMTVHCDSKNLSNLSDIFFNETIKTLILSNNSLAFKSILDEDLQIINNLTSLQHLDLSNNPLTTIPAFCLPELSELKLENTDLTSALFPQSYENCTKLQTVVLSNNKLTKINNDDLKYLKSLTKLYLDQTQLTSIDRTAFQMHLNTLETISLTSNSLESTNFLTNLNKLLWLNFDRNHLKQIPIELNKSERLQYLSLHDNQIRVVNELSPLYTWMQNNRTTAEVHLNENLFDCCESRWFVHYLNGPKNLVKDSRNLTCTSPKQYAGQRLVDLRADLMDCSDVPVDPSHSHFSKVTVILFWFLGTVLIIIVVVGLILYRSNRLHLGRHQQGYEPIDGQNINISA